MVAAEFACAMALLTGAVLLFRSFAAVLAVHPGVQADHVLTVQIELPDSWKAAEQLGFYRAVFERIRNLPGMEAVGATNSVFQLGVTRTHAHH